MTREHYLAAVIQIYLGAPNTPAQPNRSDWAIATGFWKKKISLETLRFAIQLASLRRQHTADQRQAIEPIRSLAYFRPLVIHLAEQPLEADYAEYVTLRYRSMTSKARLNRQNSAFSDSH